MTEQEAMAQDRAADKFAVYELGRNVTERGKLMSDAEIALFRAGWEAAKVYCQVSLALPPLPLDVLSALSE